MVTGKLYKVYKRVVDILAMSSDSDSEKKSERVGMGLAFLGIIIYVVFLLVVRFIFTDSSVMWQWYWPAIGLVALIGIAVCSFLLKGTLGMCMAGVLFVLSQVMLFVSWWFMSQRVLVMGSFEEVYSDSISSEAALAGHLKKVCPRRVFVFTGKKGSELAEGEKKVDEETFRKEIEKIAKDSASKKVDYTKISDKDGNLSCKTKKDGDAVVNVLKSVRFTGYFPEHLLQFDDGLNVTAACSEKKMSGLSADEFKKKYMDEKKGKDKDEKKKKDKDK